MIDYVNVSGNSVYVNFALCNIFCKNCYKRYIFVNTDVKNVLNLIKDKKIKNVHFCGGEPLINSEFMDLLNDTYCDYDVYVITNGMDLDKIKSVISVYPDINWIIKIKVIDKNMHEKIGYSISKLNKTIEYFNLNNINFSCYLDLEYSVLIDELYDYDFVLNSCQKMYVRSNSLCNISKQKKIEVIRLDDNQDDIHHIY